MRSKGIEVSRSNQDSPLAGSSSSGRTAPARRMMAAIQTAMSRLPSSWYPVINRIGSSQTTKRFARK